MADQDKIKERIRRMLALAEDERNTDGERENAMARATALMAEHRIDFITDAGRVKTDKIGSREVTHEGSYTRQKSNLLGWTAAALGMQAVHFSYGQTVTRTIVYGYESDLEMLDMLYTSLLLQQTNALSREKVPSWLYRGEVAAWKRDWLTAYNNTVSRRIGEVHARKAEQRDRERTPGTSAPGAAVAIVDRKNAVDAFVAEAHPKLRKPKPARKIVNDDAYFGGRNAGNRADIGLSRVGERRQQLPQG